MIDQKHTKEIMVSSPNRYGKNFQSLNESIAYANEGKVVLCSSTTGEAVMISREKYDDLHTQLTAVTKQRDELLHALEKCTNCTAFGDPPNYKGALLDLMYIASEALTKTKESV